MIVNEVALLTKNPTMRHRTVGVISLIGKEQAEVIRSRLSEAIGEELMQRHRILCGDSATFLTPHTLSQFGFSVSGAYLP